MSAEEMPPNMSNLGKKKNKRDKMAQPVQPDINFRERRTYIIGGRPGGVVSRERASMC
ncbi:hypothetical protein NECAME_09561 [Necator americanus]|uniref:Uncharacterized protein n=1 Tax=Necator americanus TaxID=51031 RepID=W2TFA8_NECAM|nr:hypothetical protein NECAME_09561 [Necator americanus]ETN79861.1 hypothetical protein NECAME_09561 [Necator americanus]